MTHCQTFPYLYNTSQLDVALAEKDAAAATYTQLNATAVEVVVPAMPNATYARSLRASFEAGVRISQLIAVGWRVMALGYAGDRGGGAYNVTALRGAIALYDQLYADYHAFPATYPPGIAPGLMNASYWQHPGSGPGLAASVDKYRHV